MVVPTMMHHIPYTSQSFPQPSTTLSALNLTLASTYGVTEHSLSVFHLFPTHTRSVFSLLPSTFLFVPTTFDWVTNAEKAHARTHDQSGRVLVHKGYEGSGGVVVFR